MFELFRLGMRRLKSEEAYRDLQTYIAAGTLADLNARGMTLKGRRVLEFPAGKGGYARVFRHETDQLVASDLFRAEIFDGELQGIPFQQADAMERLPFDDDSFDFVHCASLVEHLPSIDGLLSEFRRIIAPDGHLLLSFPPFWSLFMVGGHGFKPFHFLGEPLAVRLAGWRHGTTIMSYSHDFSGGGPLFVRRIGELRASMIGAGFSQLDTYARMSRVNTTRLPGALADLTTWHACFLATNPA
jgi:SAM-dependent methyltransferase